ncbi:MAG: adenylate/guanylate cyclase domain-containing protein [Myxococcota bacterium]
MNHGETLSQGSGPAELPKPPIPFRLKLTVVGGLLALVPLAIVGVLLLDANAAAVRRDSRELQMAVADDVARTVEASFVDVQNGLDSIGRLLVDSSLSPEATERLALDQVAGHEGLEHVAIYDVRGEFVDVIYEVGSSRPPLPEDLPEALQAEASRENVATGSAQPAAGIPRVLVVVPLRVGEQTSGFAASSVSLRPLEDRVQRLNEVRFDGRPNSLFVVDEQQRLVAHPDRARAGRLESMAGKGILQGVEARAVTDRFQQSGEYVDDDGREMVGTIVGVHGRPWAVVVQMPRDVVYASYYTMRTIVVTTLAVVVLLALIVAFFVARQITRPIRVLSDFARDLAERRFDRRVTLTTRDELSVLGDVMSAAAADLQESEERIEKEVAIRSDLGRYLPAELVEKVVAREQDMALGGQRREVTILFADVVAFTPLTDRLAAEEVVSLLNELFTILTEIVFRHEGTIDKFIGDCVMAMWGAPRDQADHASRAVAAAEDMMRWLEAGNAGWKEKYGIQIELAIGIHSGEAIVGNVGSESRMEFTAIGDTVNVAARLESIARPSQVLVTGTTRKAAGDAFDFHRLGERELTGRDGAVDLFEVRI